MILIKIFWLEVGEVWNEDSSKHAILIIFDKKLLFLLLDLEDNVQDTNAEKKEMKGKEKEKEKKERKNKKYIKN